ncbi:MAG: hypothetical protein HRT63_11720 [Erythrobacter sp.]|nr:hypothetical protein [Erythrobacter sp.]
MPSTSSPLLNLELQADGENLNVWGQKLNALFSRLEEAVSGAIAITVSGPVTLSSTDYVQNQHRYGMLVLSGTGGDVTVPATSKTYLVKNGCSGAVTFTHGSGTTVTVAAGKIKWIGTDGTDFFTAEEEDYLLLTGGTLTGALTLAGAPTEDLHAASKAYVDTFLPLAGGLMTGFITLHTETPTDNAHPASKGYVDGLAFNAIDLPGQTGQAGKFLTTDGTAASWGAVPFSGISGLPTTLAGYGITDAYTKAESDAAFQPLDDDLTALAARPSPREVTNSDSPVTAVSGDTIFVDCSSGAVEVDLPAATAGSLPITVIDDDGNAPTNQITLDPDGSETINGETSIEIDIARAALTLVPFAGRWQIKT